MSLRVAGEQSELEPNETATGGCKPARQQLLATVVAASPRTSQRIAQVLRSSRPRDEASTE
jgi:hypothetical protein